MDVKTTGGRISNVREMLRVSRDTKGHDRPVSEETQHLEKENWLQICIHELFLQETKNKLHELECVLLRHKDVSSQIIFSSGENDIENIRFEKYDSYRS